MYLIGFFASPLPYLLLVGIYMSGFAYVNWKGSSGASGSIDSQATAVCLVAEDHDHDFQLVGAVLYSPDQPVTQPIVKEQVGTPPSLFSGHPDLILKPLLFPPYCLSSGSLFLLTGQAIRPPPIS